MGAAAAKAIRRVPCGAALVLALVLTACASGGDDKAAEDNLAIVAAPLKPAALPLKAAPAAVASPTPVPTPTSLSQMRPHRNFTDPPLPPELRDDHGLIPLPPPPPTR